MLGIVLLYLITGLALRFFVIAIADLILKWVFKVKMKFYMVNPWIGLILFYLLFNGGYFDTNEGLTAEVSYGVGFFLFEIFGSIQSLMRATKINHKAKKNG